MSDFHADRLRRLRWAEDAVDFLIQRLNGKLEDLADRRAALEREIEGFSRAGGLPVHGWGSWTELCRQRRDLFSRQCLLRRAYLDMQDRKRYLQQRICRVEGQAAIGASPGTRERWRRLVLDPVHLTGEEPEPALPGMGTVIPARFGQRRT